MAHLDVTRVSTSVAGIAEPHQSTVAAMLRAAGLGLFTAAEADMLIDRVRGHMTVPPVGLSASIEDGFPDTVGGRPSGVVSQRPVRTLS